MTSNEARIASLEQSLRRQRIVGAAIVLVLVAAGAARQREEPEVVGSLYARSITIVDEQARPLVRLGGEACGRIEVLDVGGSRRAYLGEHAPTPGASTLELFDADSKSEIQIIAEPDGANLMMARDEGERSGLWATASTDRSMLYFDAGGFSTGAAIGAVKDESSYGGRLSMNYARPARGAGPDDAWASSGSYFVVAPDGRVDRPEEQIRRLEPD